MTGRVYPTVREAINATATRATVPMKAIAVELDWSPSELSMRTTLGDDNARVFPADDAHLVKLIEVTGDDSILRTLADRLGYELVVKRDRMPEKLAELREELAAMNKKMQLLLDLPELAPAPGKKR